VPGLKQRRTRSYLKRSRSARNHEEEDHQKDLVESQVKIVRLPNMVCESLLHALATTPHEHVFAKLSVCAVLGFSWRHVRSRFTTMLLYRCIKLAMMIAWVGAASALAVVADMTWSVLVAEAAYELCVNLYEAFGYWSYLRDPFLFFRLRAHWMDMIGIGLTLTLGFHAADTLHLNSAAEFMALVSFYQWLHVLYTLRAYQAFGRRIIPILQSFGTMGPMIIITLVTFLGFMHAQLALKQKEGGTVDSIMALYEVFRTLMAGDSSGMLWTLQTAGSDYGNFLTWCFLVGSVFLFGVCVMNLFIAVQGEAYDTAQDHMKALFLQERAIICLRSFMHPYARRKCRVQTFLVVGVVVFLAGWGGLIFLSLHVSWLHAIWPTMLLLAAMLLGDAVLLQRCWEHDEQGNTEPHYLWVCHRADWEEDREALSISDEVGRYSGVKRLIELNGADKLVPLFHGIEERLMRMEDRQSRLETHLEKISQSMQLQWASYE